MKTSSNRILLWLAMILMGITFAGCDVAEDESDCLEDLSVTFRFTKNGQDRFDTDVSSVSLFVFDQDDLFLGRWDEYDPNKLVGDYTMYLPLKPGRYNLVAWGGLHKDQYFISRTGLTTALEPIVGETRRTDLLVRLMGNSQNEVNYICTDQFYGYKQNVELMQGHNRVTVDLIKNSNRIKLSIKGISGSTRADVYPQMDMSFRSPNGASDFANKLESSGNTYTYMLQNQNLNAQELFSADIFTLRMIFNNGHRLRISNKADGSLFYEADLLEDFIRKLPAYNTQAAVDAEDLFDISIVLDDETHLAVKVTVNDWVVFESGSEIQ